MIQDFASEQPTQYKTTLDVWILKKSVQLSLQSSVDIFIDCSTLRRDAETIYFEKISFWIVHKVHKKSWNTDQNDF